MKVSLRVYLDLLIISRTSSTSLFLFYFECIWAVGSLTKGRTERRSSQLLLWQTIKRGTSCSCSSEAESEEDGDSKKEAKEKKEAEAKDAAAAKDAKSAKRSMLSGVVLRAEKRMASKATLVAARMVLTRRTPTSLASARLGARSSSLTRSMSIFV